MRDPLAHARLEKLAELLPCPFCGGAASYTDDGGRKGTARQSMIVVCLSCGARTESGDVVGLTPSSEWRWNCRRSLLADSLPREGERERIARIVDPDAFAPLPTIIKGNLAAWRAKALAKADQIMGRDDG